MKTKKRLESGAVNPRVLLATSFFFLAAVFATSSFTEGIRSADKQTVITKSSTSSLLAPESGHSIFNDIFVASMEWMRSFKAHSSEAVASRIARRSPAGAPAKASSSGTQAPSSILSDVVVATVSPPVRDLPSANQFSVWVEPPQERPLENRIRQQPIN